MIETAQRLITVLAQHEHVAVAVSGGVDSLTLATFAHRHLPGRMSAIHAVSPAVPASATARIEMLARVEGWPLTITDTGEFDDPRYRDNPQNRCYFCKTNLYNRIRDLTAGSIASGANLDDLGDYRPGLLAAAERQVVHPFIEAEMAKADVRAMARTLGLGVLAELPAQPCLASRVETGISIDAEDLAFVERAEARLTAIAPAGSTVRCRVARAGVILEFGPEAESVAAELEASLLSLCLEAGRPFAGTRAYSRGAMFIRS
ncbi:adenine nucleotide alpha hydrolase (plasmid) [Microvirga sp. RSM25]|uniref:adenine nucleotide alpha hydrolase n=1 Tax=Microvirga sp. RSM25 TaxID=3273802 RepID=UPI00384B2DFD